MIVVDNAEMRASPGATTFYDPQGNRWEVVVDADAVGVPQACVAMRARATDPRGQVVERLEPNRVVTDGEPATVSVGGDAADRVQVRVLATIASVAPAPGRTATAAPPSARGPGGCP